LSSNETIGGLKVRKFAEPEKVATAVVVLISSLVGLALTLKLTGELLRRKTLV